MIAFRAAVLALSVAPFLLSPAVAQNATTISVSLTNFKFTPNVITLKSGTTYTLHLTNNGGSGHDFAAPEFFKNSTMAPAERLKLESDDSAGDIDLDSGQSEDITLTPNKPGTYKLTCTHFMHQTFGMTGQIVVQ